MQLQTHLPLSTPMPRVMIKPSPRCKEQVGSIALFMIGPDLSIRSVNDAGRELISDEIIKTRRFATCDGAVNSRLQRWLRERVLRDETDELRLRLDTACGRTFSITAICTGHDDEACDPDDEAKIVILVQEPEAAGRSKVAMVAAAHNLTPAETRLLGLVFKGLDTPAAADHLGISKTTARTHLQRIFAKTETARQSALVHFVATFVKP